MIFIAHLLFNLYFSSNKWWPAVIVPPEKIPEHIRVDTLKVCILYFGTHNYGFITPINIRPFDSQNSVTVENNEKKMMENAKIEAKIAVEFR